MKQSLDEELFFWAEQFSDWECGELVARAIYLRVGHLFKRAPQRQFKRARQFYVHPPRIIGEQRQRGELPNPGRRASDRPALTTFNFDDFYTPRNVLLVSAITLVCVRLGGAAYVAFGFALGMLFALGWSAGRWLVEREG